ncbi:hypothetical protein QUA86_12695 [Microcoleus sp. F6_B6]
MYDRLLLRVLMMFPIQDLASLAWGRSTFQSKGYRQCTIYLA